MDSTMVPHPIGMLREMLAREIERTSTTESFMIRSGLLADKMYPRTHPGWIGGQACALAAIIETQEWAAGIAEAERLRHDTGNGFDSQPCRNVAWRIREAIKEGPKQ